MTVGELMDELARHDRNTRVRLRVAYEGPASYCENCECGSCEGGGSGAEVEEHIFAPVELRREIPLHGKATVWIETDECH